MIPGPGRSAGEGIGYFLQYSWASLVAQLVKKVSSVISCSKCIRPLYRKEFLLGEKKSQSNSKEIASHTDPRAKSHEPRPGESKERRQFLSHRGWSGRKECFFLSLSLSGWEQTDPKVEDPFLTAWIISSEAVDLAQCLQNAPGSKQRVDLHTGSGQP